MISKRKRKKDTYKEKTCLSKNSYATELDAAHTAGVESLRNGTKLKIYKCPYGDHYHIGKYNPKYPTPFVPWSKKSKE